MTNYLMILKWIKELNTSQLGSLGEHLAGLYFSDNNYTFETVHRDLADFTVEGELIDVKTTKKYIDKNFDPNTNVLPYKGKRLRPDVTYLHVLFFKDKIIISDDTSILTSYSIERFNTFLQTYEKRLPSKDAAESRVLKDNWNKLKGDISDWFLEKTGKRVRCLYRGPADWGKQPPDNSYPTDKISKTFSGQVFVQFKGGKKRPEDIKFIIAFPFSHINLLPIGLVPKRVAVKGIDRTIDIYRIYAEKKKYKNYYYTDIKDLKKYYLKRFPMESVQYSTLCNHLREKFVSPAWEVNGFKSLMIHHIGFRKIISKNRKIANPRLQFYTDSPSKIRLVFYWNRRSLVEGKIADQWVRSLRSIIIESTKQNTLFKKHTSIPVTGKTVINIISPATILQLNKNDFDSVISTIESCISNWLHSNQEFIRTSIKE